jgi:hypothetical protein
VAIVTWLQNLPGGVMINALFDFFIQESFFANSASLR